VILDDLARHAAERPAADALVTPAERCSYGELAGRVAARAGASSPGRTVPVPDGDGATFLVDFLAALRAGARPLVLHQAPTPFELAGLTGQQAADDEVARGEILLPTSGSTAEPRIARLGQEAVAWNAAAHARSVGLVGEGHRLLIAGSLAHAATLVAQVAAGLQLGAALVVAPRPFTARAFFETVSRERVTATALTPTHVRWLLDPRADRALAAVDVACLQIVTVGSAPVDPEAIRGLALRFPAARVFVTYGLTEAGPRVTTLAPEDFAAHPDSVGRPLPGVAVRVAHPADPHRELPPGTEGELQVLTPGRMRGYLGEPPPAGDWLRTGDLAVMDADGFVTLRGRLKEIIVSGGAKISPREVERALCEDDRVQEAAVVAEPHEALGEVVKAYVVPAAPLDADEILAALATRLSAHKLPRRLVVVDALPRTPAGKVDKRRLGAT